MILVNVVVLVLVLGFPTPAMQPITFRLVGRQTQPTLKHDSEKLDCKSAMVQLAKVNDIVEGRQISESDQQELYVDTGPCTCKAVSFHKPYDKEEIGTVTCEGKTFKKVRATQRKRKR